jgi:hypothetical protein
MWAFGCYFCLLEAGASFGAWGGLSEGGELVCSSMMSYIGEREQGESLHSSRL